MRLKISSYARMRRSQVVSQPGDLLDTCGRQFYLRDGWLRARGWPRSKVPSTSHRNQGPPINYDPFYMTSANTECIAVVTHPTMVDRYLHIGRS